ncbi:MAG: cation transporting ATPase C-terminal domain-containing protein [Eubacterium sp.]
MAPAIKSTLFHHVVTSYISLVAIFLYPFLKSPRHSYRCSSFSPKSLRFSGTPIFIFVLFQLFNAFNCRELHSQIIIKHLFKNKQI